MRSLCVLFHLICLALAGCASVEMTPLAPAGAALAEDQNPVYFPLGKEQYGQVFENVLRVLSDMGFEIADGGANRYAGSIETRPRTAPGLLLFLKPGSPDLHERLLATTQSYRHRLHIIIHPADQGGYFIEVVARKELEDLPKPIKSTVGSAIFRMESEIDRTFEVVDPSVFESNWLPKGRDCALEQEIIRRLKKLM